MVLVFSCQPDLEALQLFPAVHVLVFWKVPIF